MFWLWRNRFVGSSVFFHSASRMSGGRCAILLAVFPLLAIVIGAIKERVLVSKTIEAVYENGVFRPLEAVTLPEGEHVQVTVPEASEEIQQRLAALDAFDASLENLTEEQWQRFDEAVQRHPWFGGRELDL
jgi:predicted DNA-binding antitoxin AbrB/MazE fold protein